MDRFERLAGALRRIPGLEVWENEPMKRHTTFRIGGPARLMALPRSRKEAAAAVRAATEVGIAPFFLGNGSNLLVADHGYEGFVLKAWIRCVRSTAGCGRRAVSPWPGWPTLPWAGGSPAWSLPTVSPAHWAEPW